MKALSKIAAILFFVTISAVLSSCFKEREYKYDALVPVYMSFEEFRSSFKTSAPKEINKPGKIYFKDNYIFVNEVNEGIHIIDNSNPSNPIKVIFYEIAGNVDIAIRDNILFADSYIDLVAFDISNINEPIEISRIENAFPEILPFPLDGDFPIAYGLIDKQQGVVVDWKIAKVKESYTWRPWDGRFVTYDGAVAETGQAGIAGSMARFMLYQNYLYSIAQPWVLKTININSPDNMLIVDSIETWREMETLFRLNENLFVGTTTGMVIYSLSNPAKPSFISDFNHANACDPVVVENDIAYVTLRSGNICFGDIDQLDVIDISDILNPVLIKTYPMHNPHGLGIDNNILFICDGSDGLKIYDASDPLSIAANMIKHFPDIDAFDVIPLGDILILIGQDGLFQYDYSDLENIQVISQISFSNNRKRQ